MSGKGEDSLFIDDWGEQMIGQHKGIIACADVLTSDVTVLPLPQDFTPGELIFVPGTHDIVGVANVSRPYKIGLAYCSDRESILFKMDQNGKYGSHILFDWICAYNVLFLEELMPWGMHVKAPRFHGDTLVYQKSYIFGDRAPAAQLWKMNWKNKEVNTEKIYRSFHLNLE